MAGRLSLKFLKKSTTTDEKKSESSETHSSTQSTPIPIIKSAGRGLVRVFPIVIKKHVEKTEFDRFWNALPEDDNKKKVIVAALAKRMGLVVGSLP